MQPADHMDRQHEQPAEQNPGPDAAVEQFGNGLLRGQPDDDQHHAGRNHHPEGRAAGDRAGAQLAVIAVFVHLGQGHGGHGGRRGRVGTADRRKGAAGQDRRHGHPATDMTDPLIGRAIEFLVDP